MAVAVVSRLRAIRRRCTTPTATSWRALTPSKLRQGGGGASAPETGDDAELGERAPGGARRGEAGGPCAVAEAAELLTAASNTSFVSSVTEGLLRLQRTHASARYGDGGRLSPQLVRLRAWLGWVRMGCGRQRPGFRAVRWRMVVRPCGRVPCRRAGATPPAAACWAETRR
jgi:hypothetical protein